MKVKELNLGDCVRPVDGMSFHLDDNNVWVLPPPDSLAIFSVANLVFDQEKSVNLTPCALYLGRSVDDIEVVGAYTSYNFLILGTIYKISGYEIRYLERLYKEKQWKGEPAQ